MIERAPDGEPPLHPTRQRVDEVVAPVGELHELEELLGAPADLGARQVEVAAVDHEVVEDGQLGVEAVLLGHDAEAGPDARAVDRGIEAEDAQLAARRLDTQPIIRMVDVLPAPFGPEEAERLTRLDLEVDAVDRDEVAEALGEVRSLDQRPGSRE